MKLYEIESDGKYYSALIEMEGLCIFPNDLI